ncbi:unnamed protein product [Darwinula stevensoni]|uniref:ZBR-type domain-containing protein n=1 Tax=Darwinula stevensoni TaxID=69355 RepID=A0A7R9ABH6_9CRUS|nr:unnamed protein product [Darwinula stevensoni]CAG0899437.1 unnamed protein product [Darwinula stevensoni]
MESEIPALVYLYQPAASEAQKGRVSGVAKESSLIGRAMGSRFQNACQLISRARVPTQLCPELLRHPARSLIFRFYLFYARIFRSALLGGKMLRRVPSSSMAEELSRSACLSGLNLEVPRQVETEEKRLLPRLSSSLNTVGRIGISPKNVKKSVASPLELSPLKRTKQQMPTWSQHLSFESSPETLRDSSMSDSLIGSLSPLHPIRSSKTDLSSVSSESPLLDFCRKASRAQRRFEFAETPDFSSPELPTGLPLAETLSEWEKCDVARANFSTVQYVRPKPFQAKAIATPVSSLVTSSKLCAVPKRLCFAGEPTVDVLLELTKLGDCPPALTLLLSYLSPKDLCRVCVVSQAWRQAVLGDPCSDRRRKRFLEECRKLKKQMGKENVVRKSFSETPSSISRTGKSSPCKNLSNTDFSSGSGTSGSSETPYSPSKRKFLTFFEAGRRLNKDEHLTPCPHCSSPARVDRHTHRAECTGRSCHYYFCSRCLTPPHPNNPCSSVQGRLEQSAPVGSSKSRRNLRRL